MKTLLKRSPIGLNLLIFTGIVISLFACSLLTSPQTPPSTVTSRFAHFKRRNFSTCFCHPYPTNPLSHPPPPTPPSNPSPTNPLSNSSPPNPLSNSSPPNQDSDSHRNPSADAGADKSLF